LVTQRLRICSRRPARAQRAARAHLRVLRVALLQHVFAHDRDAAVLRHVERVCEACDAAAQNLRACGA
jgi:hypothetical protein